MKIVDTLIHPHACHLCNSGLDGVRKFIDTEIPFTDPGAKHLKATKYICSLCAEEIAALTDVGDQFKVKILGLERDKATLSAAIRNAQQALK